MKKLKVVLCASLIYSFAVALLLARPVQAEGFAGGVFIEAICDLFNLTETHLGALLLTAMMMTGLVAAIGGQSGYLKSAVALAVASVGLSTGISFYFGDFNCSTSSTSSPPSRKAPPELLQPNLDE